MIDKTIEIFNPKESNTPAQIIQLKDIKEVKETKKEKISSKLSGHHHFKIKLKDNTKLLFYIKQEQNAQQCVQNIKDAQQYILSKQFYLKAEGKLKVQVLKRNQSQEFDFFQENKQPKGLKRVYSGIEFEKNTKTEQNQQDSNQQNLPELELFDQIEELGSGSFGRVTKVQHRINGQIYALKALDRKSLKKRNQLKYALSEVKILKNLNHPFIIKLIRAFQTNDQLFLLLEFCPNKDLSKHIENLQRFSEQVAIFYIAEVIIALDYLHQNNIVYRDLKPENILLDSKGHIKLIDFGLAKESTKKYINTKSFCGSPAYLAPEMLTRKGIGMPADIYGVGAMLYEMLFGKTPFFSQDLRELFVNIKLGDLQFPNDIEVSNGIKKFIKTCMNNNPEKRPTALQLMQDPIFSNINWDNIMNEKAPLCDVEIKEHLDFQLEEV